MGHNVQVLIRRKGVPALLWRVAPGTGMWSRCGSGGWVWPQAATWPWQRGDDQSWLFDTANKKHTLIG
jgi:hypothetical protein